MREMIKDFPELTIEKVLVKTKNDPRWQPYSWLKTKDGKIIESPDYGLKGIIEYKRVEEI